MKKHLASVLLAPLYAAASLCAFASSAATSFTPLDIDSSDRLLLRIRDDDGEKEYFDSVFLSRIQEKTSPEFPLMLTAYPERMELLDGGTSVQIRNRYGEAVFSLKKNTVERRSVSRADSSRYTHVPPASESPDGKWLCILRPEKNAAASIILRDASNGKEVILSDACENSYDALPVKWAPDSKTVLYEKKGVIYFATPDSMFRAVGLSEEMRVIGSGSINCVSWTDGKNMLYVHDDIIYRIYENELYNRAMYAPVVGYGTIVARLPFLFDSGRDRLWAGSDGKSFVTVTGQNIVSWYSCGRQGLYFADVNAMFPVPANDGSIVDSRIFWTPDKKPVLWVESISYEDGGRVSSAYSIEKNATLKLSAKNATAPKISPDGKKIAFAAQNEFSVYDISSWKKTGGYSGQEIKSFCWKNSSSLILGGNRTVFEWNVQNSRQNFLLLSSAEEACFAGGKICAECDGTWYEYSDSDGSWKERPAVSKKQSAAVSNGRYRAYSTGSGINIRALSGGMQTYPLFATEENNAGGKKKIAIVFDAVENADGLAKILSDINRFGIKTTFFINGEFIRRYPLETKQLAFSAVECASGFYSSADLLSPAFKIDAQFIKRGLARNEDEFLAATGKELSLLWHAPAYRDNTMMREAGSQSGYTYVDAVPVKSAADKDGIIADLLANLEDGTVLSLTVGKNTENANAYLTEHLDLLLDALLSNGWEICPVEEITGNKQLF